MYSKENYHRQKFKFAYYCARWKHFFETGDMLPVDAWRELWKQKKHFLMEDKKNE